MQEESHSRQANTMTSTTTPASTDSAENSSHCDFVCSWAHGGLILAVFGVVIYSIVKFIIPARSGCDICPLGGDYMSEPFRIVPGGSGMTCAELMLSQSICKAHEPLMQRFDLASYCGCEESSPPRTECIFDCQLPWKEDIDGFSTPPAPIGGRAAPPALSPSPLPEEEPNPTQNDKIILDDFNLSSTENSSSYDGNEEPPRQVRNIEPRFSSEGFFDANKMECTELSTFLPFVTDQMFCNEVKDYCCSSIAVMAQAVQDEIPQECIMCGHGYQIDEEKPLPGNDDGETCGSVSRFYEHASNALFCEYSIPLLREHCCREVDPIQYTQLETASSSPASLSLLSPMFYLVISMAASVMLARE